MTNTSPIEVRDVVLGLWRALAQRDWDAVKTFLAADCLYVDMPVRRWPRVVPTTSLPD